MEDIFELTPAGWGFFSKWNMLHMLKKQLRIMILTSETNIYMEIKEYCIKEKESQRTIGVYDFKNSKLSTNKVGKNIWISYHTNKNKLSNVSCES